MRIPRGGHTKHDDQTIALFMISIVLSIAGWGLATTGVGSSCPGGSAGVTPPSPCWIKIQHGFGSCTINTGSNLCHFTATFNPAYPIKPFVDGEFNGTVPIPTVLNIISTNVVENIPLVFHATNNETWVNMPTTDTELFGKNSTRLTWTVPAIFTSQSAQVCVNFETVTTFPSLTVQFSTTQNGPWTYLGDASFYATPGATAGLSCGPIETPGAGLATLVQGTQYFFRVVGNDLLGPVNDGFGTIELQISGTALSTLSLHIPITCTLTFIQAQITTTQVNVFVQCGNSPIEAPKTYTANWWAGITG